MKRRKKSQKANQIELQTYVLTEQDRTAVEECKAALQPENLMSLTTFGLEIQRAVAKLPKMILQNLDKKEQEEINSLMTSTLTYLEDIEQEESREDTFWQKQARSVLLRNRYDAVRTQVERTESALQKRHTGLLMDKAMLAQLYELNQEYMRQLQIRIAAAGEVLQEIKEGSHRIVADYASEDSFLSTVKDRLSEKIKDLKLTSMVAAQQAAQLLLLEKNASSQAMGVQTILYNMIPMWKDQMITAFGNEQNKREAAGEVVRTNRLLRQSLHEYARKEQENEDMLQNAEIEIHKMEQTLEKDIQ